MNWHHNVPVCDEHKKPCFLKTGLKQTSSYLKSFFICSQLHKTCNFVQEAIGVQAIFCKRHPNSYVEIQAINYSQSEGYSRLFFRCKSVDKSIAWCGNQSLAIEPCSKQSIHITNLNQDKISPNPISNNTNIKSNDHSCMISSEENSMLTKNVNPVINADFKKDNKVMQNIKFMQDIQKDIIVQNKPITEIDYIQINDSFNYRDNSLLNHDDEDDDNENIDKNGINNDIDIIVINNDLQMSDVTKNKNMKVEVKHLTNQTNLSNKQENISQKLLDDHLKNLTNICDDMAIILPNDKIKPITSYFQKDAIVVKNQEVIRNDITIDMLKLSLKSKKDILKMVNMEKLPDKGLKLSKEIKDLETRILNYKPSSANLQTTNMPTMASNKPHLTHNYGIKLTEARPLPFGGVHVDDHMDLYGGRMTANRLAHVGQVTAEAIEKLHRQYEACPDDQLETDDPNNLCIPLMQHQRQALTWLIWREAENPRGGILADDMGLGKTLTMIAFTLKQMELKKKDTNISRDQWLDKSKKLIQSEGTLVICPASLLHQWKNEIDRRVKPGSVDVIVYHGPNRDSSQSRLVKADFVLTTYNLIGKEVGVPEDLKKNKTRQEMPCEDEAVDDSKTDSMLLRIQWHRIILDEGHAIKNHKSLTAMSICRLRAVCRWVLTGTPIHNDLLDIYSLLRFLRCSPFDEYKVWKRQVDNKSEQGTRRLNTLVKTLLLRRTKDQKNALTGNPLISLPSKNVETYFLTLSSIETVVYQKIFKTSQAKVEDYLNQMETKKLASGNNDEVSSAFQSSAFNQAGFNQNEGRMGAGKCVLPSSNRNTGTQILVMLLRLRQCCSHLFLLKNAIDEEEFKSDELDLDLNQQLTALSLAENDAIDEMQSRTAKFEKENISSKIEKLLQLLNSSHKSDNKTKVKSVIVSQWTRMLEIVEWHLIGQGYKCCTIKGNVAVKERANIVDKFNMENSGPEIMLLSLRAGGVGLNLIGGSHLYILDLHWNPALEQQACDRIFRVGQKQNVFIHRFVCNETIEQQIVVLQKQKTKLATNILAGNVSNASKLSLHDLKMLFGLMSPHQAAFNGF